MNTYHIVVSLSEPSPIWKRGLEPVSIRGGGETQGSDTGDSRHYAVHPDIGFYGNIGNREWKQYALPDDNEPEAGTCPFHTR